MIEFLVDSQWPCLHHNHNGDDNNNDNNHNNQNTFFPSSIRTPPTALAYLLFSPRSLLPTVYSTFLALTPSCPNPHPPPSTTNVKAPVTANQTFPQTPIPILVL